MGFGWTTSNLPDSNIYYNGALEHFPSSAKSETMDILTALLVSPPNSNVTIYTDSQSSIKTYYSSANLSAISPRRYNKINNHIL